VASGPEVILKGQPYPVEPTGVRAGPMHDGRISPGLLDGFLQRGHGGMGAPALGEFHQEPVSVEEVDRWVARALEPRQPEAIGGGRIGRELVMLGVLPQLIPDLTR